MQINRTIWTAVSAFILAGPATAQDGKTCFLMSHGSEASPFSISSDGIGIDPGDRELVMRRGKMVAARQIAETDMRTLEDLIMGIAPEGCAAESGAVEVSSV